MKLRYDTMTRPQRAGRHEAELLRMSVRRVAGNAGAMPRDMVWYYNFASELAAAQRRGLLLALAARAVAAKYAAEGLEQRILEAILVRVFSVRDTGLN